MNIGVRFNNSQEAQRFMQFLQKIYSVISDMEKYSVDAEKNIIFLTGEPTSVRESFNDSIITARFSAGMPLHAMYIFCWLAVKSSYRNNNGAPVVFVNSDTFELTYAYQTQADTQKILVTPQGFCVNNGEDSILSYILGQKTGFMNFIANKLQQRHINHIEENLHQLDRLFMSHY